jgi:phosphoribosylamine-glycine ligase
MRFAFVGPKPIPGCSLPMQARLSDEGHEVAVWIGAPESEEVGEGIVEHKESLPALVAWAREKPSIVVFDECDMGAQADILRRQGLRVMFSSRFNDKLEKDRVFGSDIAKELGLNIPKTIEFGTIQEAIDWAHGHKADHGWVWKTDKYLKADTTFSVDDTADLPRYLEDIRTDYGDDVPSIVQEQLEGVALSTNSWFNGQTFLEPYLGTIEHKRFMNDDIGPSTGCALNLSWAYDGIPKIAQDLHFDKVADMLRRNQAPVGIYDINALIATRDGKPYFLEWTPRMGYDSEPTSLRLVDDLGEFWTQLVDGKLSEAPFATDRFAMSVRLSVPPYPWEVVTSEKKSAHGIPLGGFESVWEDAFMGYGVAKDDDDKYFVADWHGLVGLAIVAGTNLAAMDRELNERAGTIKGYYKSLQYRTDVGRKLIEDIKALDKLGYVIKVSSAREAA